MKWIRAAKPSRKATLSWYRGALFDNWDEFFNRDGEQAGLRSLGATGSHLPEGESFRSELGLSTCQETLRRPVGQILRFSRALCLRGVGAWSDQLASGAERFAGECSILIFRVKALSLFRLAADGWD